MRFFLRSGPLLLMNASTPKSYGSSGFLIASACLLLLLSFGYRAGFGLFVRPITEANGWSREIISIALAVQNLIWGIIAFFAGGLVVRPQRQLRYGMVAGRRFGCDGCLCALAHERKAGAAAGCRK
jgi:hypothetical protein